MASFFDNEKEVVPLIIYEEGNYTVCDSTLKWLDSLGEICVIACAGKYRTGKSFLLNRLASADSNIGFGVGDSVQACTKGLWIYKKVFESHGKRIIFIDTEGIDALDANDTHDVRIFTLALLLSSAFIYNSMGPIDETALQTLSLMTRVTENVKFDGNDDIKDLAPHMPNFYWILRDFSLKLTNKEGNEISENEYLDQALQISTDPTKNSVRQAIRGSFPNRTLITLPRPSMNEQSAVRLEDSLIKLSRTFVSGIDSLRTRLFEEIKPLRAQDTVITGKMYSTLCQHYTEIVQSNAVPVIKDSWTLIASVQARDLKDDLIAECLEKISTMKPKPKDSLDVDMKHLKNLLLENFQRKSMKPIDEEVKNSLKNRLDDICEEAQRRLELNISESVEKSLQNVEPLIEKNPQDLAMILNNELSDFNEKNGNQSDFSRAWMLAASERALCRWIPRSLQSLSSDRDEKIEKLRNAEENWKNEMNLLKEQNEEIIREEKIKHAEIEQLNDSNKHVIELERNDNLRLRSELITMSADMKLLEETKLSEHCLTSDITTKNNITNSNQALEMQDELSIIKLESAELKANLSLEKSNHEKCKRMHKDTNERLEKAMSMQAQLEENWKAGIDKLRKEQQQMYEKQKNDYENRIQNLCTEISKLQSSYEKTCLIKDEIAHENKIMKEKHEQELSLSESNSKNLRENAHKCREQADQAQNRVLEIHRSMLEDLRLRDDRAREQQCKFLKETNEFQQKISEMTRENESYKSDINGLKRKITELEPMELECKKFRTNEKEKDIMIAQLNTENNEVRATNAEILQDRETLRRENMEMQSELSLLRAEKQMNEVRKAMSGN